METSSVVISSMQSKPPCSLMKKLDIIVEKERIRYIAMEFLKGNIFKDFNFQKDEQNTETKICKVESELGVKFPQGLRSILKLYNGGSGKIGNLYLDIWSLEDIVDFYHDNMAAAENLIPFASDGCGMSFTLNKGAEEIRVIPMDSLEFEYSKICSNSFDELIHEMYSGNLIEY